MVVQRLGHAITRRRKYLEYRQRHHAKLSQGLDQAQGIRRTATGSVLSGTQATEFVTQNIAFDENDSNTGASQTSYAPSLIQGGPITIPPLPKASTSGKLFECPYCYGIISISGERSWTRHVFKDIKPYVCIVSGCSTPEKLYDSRREWYSHHKSAHNAEDLTCPLLNDDCEKTMRTSKQFERHVGRHLEELALFILSPPELCDDDKHDEDNEREVARLSVDAKKSAAALENEESEDSDDGSEVNSSSLGSREDCQSFAQNTKESKESLKSNITTVRKDLVSSEAIEEAGYVVSSEFKNFYCLSEHLSNVCLYHC